MAAAAVEQDHFAFIGARLAESAASPALWLEVLANVLLVKFELLRRGASSALCVACGALAGERCCCCC